MQMKYNDNYRMRSFYETEKSLIFGSFFINKTLTLANTSDVTSNSRNLKFEILIVFIDYMTVAFVIISSIYCLWNCHISSTMVIIVFICLV